MNRAAAVSVTSPVNLFFLCSSLVKGELVWPSPEELQLEGKREKKYFCYINIDRTTIERATFDRTTIDIATIDRVTIDKTTIDRTTIDKTTIDRTTIDRATNDRTTIDRTTTDRA